MWKYQSVGIAEWKKFKTYYLRVKWLVFPMIQWNVLFVCVVLSRSRIKHIAIATYPHSVASFLPFWRPLIPIRSRTEWDDQSMRHHNQQAQNATVGCRIGCLWQQAAAANIRFYDFIEGWGSVDCCAITEVPSIECRFMWSCFNASEMFCMLSC